MIEPRRPNAEREFAATRRSTLEFFPVFWIAFGGFGAGCWLARR
jgi:hypothetical protein